MKKRLTREEFEKFDLETHGFIELTEDQLRYEVNGGWGKSSSSSTKSCGSGSSKSTGNSTSSKTTNTNTKNNASSKNTNTNTGSKQVANTNHAVANAKVGDTVTRNNGTTVTLTQGDINYAKAHDNTPNTATPAPAASSKQESTGTSGQKPGSTFVWGGSSGNANTNTNQNNVTYVSYTPGKIQQEQKAGQTEQGIGKSTGTSESVIMTGGDGLKQKEEQKAGAAYDRNASTGGVTNPSKKGKEILNSLGTKAKAVMKETVSDYMQAEKKKAQTIVNSFEMLGSECSSMLNRLRTKVQDGRKSNKTIDDVCMENCGNDVFGNNTGRYINLSRLQSETANRTTNKNLGYKENDVSGTIMYASDGRNPYAYPKTFEEWSGNVKDFWVNLAKNTELIPEGNVQVVVIRPNEDYGNSFNSLRVSIKNDSGEIKVYTDMVGANAEESMAKLYKGMTRPDGDYYYTTKDKNNSIYLKNEKYNSPSYVNILREITNDSRISESVRELINNDMYLSHCNVKKGNHYPGGPWSAGCAIVDGQEAQDTYIDFLNPHINENGIVDNVSIKYISGVY